MGGISKREGMCVYISLIHFIVQQKLTQFCKAIVLLFSRKVKPNTFGTPWTSAHQPPLSMGFPGKNTGVSCHFLLQGIFLTQGLNLHLLCLLGFLHCRQMLYPLNHLGSHLASYAIHYPGGKRTLISYFFLAKSQDHFV